MSKIDGVAPDFGKPQRSPLRTVLPSFYVIFGECTLIVAEWRATAGHIRVLENFAWLFFQTGRSGPSGPTGSVQCGDVIDIRGTGRTYRRRPNSVSRSS